MQPLLSPHLATLNNGFADASAHGAGSCTCAVLPFPLVNPADCFSLSLPPFRMLEDPTYNSVVRWGNDGASFVVLENEKFTKTILPKHFKHSNFASFVRQLNKYDFHKVRHNDEGGQATYGHGAWEFKHPEFRQHKKDNLDNIRRKAPAARKVTVAEEPFPATQQIVLLNDSLTATQHQVQALQERYTQMAQTNKVLVDELFSIKKLVRAQHQVHMELITHLNNIDEQRRRTIRQPGHPNHPGHNASGQYHHPTGAGLGMLPDGADEPAIELRRAREILNNVSTESVADRELERLTTMFQANAGNSPPESAGSSSVIFSAPGTGAGSVSIGMNDINDMRHLVYPAGQNAGIDPFHADHINNIPYTRPLSNPNAGPEMVISPSLPSKETIGSLWGSQKPKILLVEDDKVCARIGAKFLSQVDCTVEIARDGSEAVAKVNQEPERFDLIFMDIIMPVFDGVSATACIRIAAPRIPIVAMTSNIRSEDVATYFHWGMNDVLAKPFTKEGMVRILKKHLPYLLKIPPQPSSGEDMAQLSSSGPPPGYINPGNMGPMNAMQAQQSLSAISASGGVKFETTPIQSPATSASWHSPSTAQIQHTSPNMDASAGYMPTSVNGGGSGGPSTGGPVPNIGPRQPYPGGPSPAIGSTGLRGLADPMTHDERPEKRQRLASLAERGIALAIIMNGIVWDDFVQFQELL
ncbi:stress response transcription factor [Grosmannia clavigera kw1407]|uniref:Transcription factor n=1 Tax=Grosmannia clavigera (strain kw1407 / UAMH 11150) TaxID=655863 RepID=F0XR85_GROCL|nr:stress response transcription factor [Grosmannia clavigera kw1407]EFW99706.1 stress response transcription factor [Grosmannia clavigera kw1407]